VKLKFDDGIAIITNIPSGIAQRPQTARSWLSSTRQSLKSEKVLPSRALIITGEGSKAFVAGADIGEMADLTPDEAVAFSRRGQAVFSAIEHLPYSHDSGCKRVRPRRRMRAGACMRHTNLLRECPLRPVLRVGLGIIPGFGGTVRLPLAIGRSRAAYMILTGKAGFGQGST